RRGDGILVENDRGSPWKNRDGSGTHAQDKKQRSEQAGPACNDTKTGFADGTGREDGSDRQNTERHPLGRREPHRAGKLRKQGGDAVHRRQPRYCVPARRAFRMTLAQRTVSDFTKASSSSSEPLPMGTSPTVTNCLVISSV